MDRAERPRLRPAPVTVSLQPDRLDLRPGRSGDVTVRVTNTGTLVSHYDLVVRGIPAGQAVADPPRVELNPGDTRTVALRITVGEPGPPYAGRHVLGVVLRDAASARCEELTVTVAEAASLDLTVRPEAADGEPAAEYELALTNTGNTPLATRLGAQIADRGVECTLSPATVTVGPGATATARLAVTAPRPWTGNATRSLGVVAAAGSLRAEKQVLMRQRPRIPVGLMWVAGPLSAALVLAATIGGTALVLRRPPPKAAPTAPAPAPARSPAQFILDFDRTPGDTMISADRFAPDGLDVSTVIDRATPDCTAATALALRTDPLLGTFLTGSDPGSILVCNSVPLRFRFRTAARVVRLTYAGEGEHTFVAQLTDGTLVDCPVGAAPQVSYTAPEGKAIASVVFSGGDPVAVKQLAYTEG